MRTVNALFPAFFPTVTAMSVKAATTPRHFDRSGEIRTAPIVIAEQNDCGFFKSLNH